MHSEQDELAQWCRREREDALRQLKLFGSGGVKAVLQMPDGTMQDITEAVIKHQTDNIAVFERLIAALTPGA